MEWKQQPVLIENIIVYLTKENHNWMKVEEDNLNCKKWNELLTKTCRNFY